MSYKHPKSAYVITMETEFSVLPNSRPESVYKPRLLDASGDQLSLQNVINTMCKYPSVLSSR